MNDEQYGLLFDVRRSARYHDRRRAFFERMHQVTAALTILLAGSVLFDIAKPGDSPGWMQVLAILAAILSACDMVVGYSSKAGMHRDLKARFGTLEISMLSGDGLPQTWIEHQNERLRIELDEPPIYKAVDLLCRNELLRAEGIKDTGDQDSQFAKVNDYQRLTRHLFHWADINPV